MAFTLKIKAKALLGNKKIDIGKLLKNCNMCYGSSNEFYILEEKKVNQNTVILYKSASMPHIG